MPCRTPIYGADGLILTAAASENYILDGSFDAEQFATGDYALAIGPATEGRDRTANLLCG